MKWIEIAKAKPKFGEDYLVSTLVGGKFIPVVGHLDSTNQTKDGLKHNFLVDGTDNPVQATHIALITVPGTKEVDNG